MPNPNRYYNNLRLSLAGLVLKDWVCIIYPVVGLNDTRPLKYDQKIIRHTNDSYYIEIIVDKSDFYTMPKLTNLYADMRRMHI